MMQCLRQMDESLQAPLAQLPVGEEVTAIGTVKKVSTRRPRAKMTIVEATIFDGGSYLFAIWFNQPFRARQLTE